MANKAVLIFDMPEACWKCPCEYDGMGCTAIPNFKSFPEGFDTTEEKPTSDCPSPVPSSPMKYCIRRKRVLSLTNPSI